MQYSGSVSTAGILASIEHLYQVPYLGEASVGANGNINATALLVADLRRAQPATLSRTSSGRISRSPA